MLNGTAPWQSHVTRLKTESNMLTVTTRTPDSISRREQTALTEVRASVFTSDLLNVRELKDGRLTTEDGGLTVPVLDSRSSFLRRFNNGVVSRIQPAGRLAPGNVDARVGDQAGEKHERRQTVPCPLEPGHDRTDMGMFLAQPAEPACLEELVARFMDSARNRGASTSRWPDDPSARPFVADALRSALQGT